MFSIKPKVELEHYVVFDYSTRKKWYMKLLKPGFAHCYVMKKSDAGNFWIVINPMHSHIDIDYRSTTTFPTARDYAGEQAKIVKVTTFIDPLASTFKFGIITCVDVVMRHLGKRSWLVWTPYQLYKYLRKHDDQYI